MDSLDLKAVDYFNGKVVRKDLTSLMKKSANVPTYVLEYLLGMYCATDDEKIIQVGIENVKRILSQNFIKPDQSEYIKSKIRENGKYSIIDMISVRFDENEDKYIAYFTNLKIATFEFSPDLVVHNEKLLLGGIWCLVGIEYSEKPADEPADENDFFDVFGLKQRTRRKKAFRSKYESPFKIFNIKPIQMPDINLQEIIDYRKEFNKEEWLNLLLRSVGYESSALTPKQRLHFLLRLVPMIQKNYNLVELGPRGTGKSHVYSELSPYSILISGGGTTSSNLFYNVGRRHAGLVGNWDCIAFDEVGGMKRMSDETIQIMKNYMANGTFARGQSSINAEASFAFEGNTFKSVAEMLRTSHLFDSFPTMFNNDSAFFDRIHAFLPGWETPKLRNSLFTNNFGLISDCLAEFCHNMRKLDFSDGYEKYFTLNKSFNARDEIAVKRTFSGLAKLMYPNGKMKKAEAKELLEYAIECRRRVKEQLRKMTPTEFDDVNLGYIDIKTNIETIVRVPEQPEGTLVSDGFEQAGYVYAVGRSVEGRVGVYRLENILLDGSGQLRYKNIEGIGFGYESAKKSIISAFNYFSNHIQEINRTNIERYDYALYFNDLQFRGVSDDVSVAEVVGLCGALMDRPCKPSTVIAGRVVMSGNVMSLSSSVEEALSSAINAGAKNILLPYSSYNDYVKATTIDSSLINVLFYNTPIEAVKIALELGDLTINKSSKN